MFVRDKNEEIDFESRLVQCGKAKVFYELLGYLLFSIGFGILVAVRFALVGIQRRRPCKKFYLSSILYYSYTISLFGYYFCQYKSENYDAVKNIIQYTKNNPNTMNGSDFKVL